MPVVNGINYNEKMITDEELAVVEAMRAGAEIDVIFHGLTEIDQVDGRMNLFSAFPKDGFSWIEEKDLDGYHNYISFVKQMKGIDVACFLDIEKVTPPASNE